MEENNTILFNEEYVDFKVMCKYFGIKDSTGREWCNSKGFPHLRINNGPKSPYRMKLSKVEEWLVKRNKE